MGDFFADVSVTAQEELAQVSPGRCWSADRRLGGLS